MIETFSSSNSINPNPPVRVVWSDGMDNNEFMIDGRNLATISCETVNQILVVGASFDEIVEE